MSHTTNNECAVGAPSIKNECAVGAPSMDHSFPTSNTNPTPMPTMTSPSHPKEKLIYTAANLVHRQGWTATGINQILSEAGIPKGSFYYYFRSKEALGVAVLQKHTAALDDVLTRTLKNPTLPIEECVNEYFRDLTKSHHSNEFRYGCAIGSFVDEVATQSPLLLSEGCKAFQIMEDAWVDLIKRGQQSGIISSELTALDTAKLIVAQVQGALLMMKCSVNVAPIMRAHNMVFETLFRRPMMEIGMINGFTEMHALAS